MSEDELILTHILQCSLNELLIQKPPLTSQQHQTFIEYKRRRASGEPLQYILGTWNFMGLELKVTPDVLIPRPETEQLVELALSKIKHIKTPNVLDIGTGSGNIAIAIAKFHPGAKVTSIDISAEALKIAQENATHHHVTPPIHFINADIKVVPDTTFFSRLVGTEKIVSGTTFFDVVISNPPYIPLDDIARLPVDVQREPIMALNGGVDGLDFYRTIIKSTARLLSPGGWLMMEIGDGQWNAISALIKNCGDYKSWDVACDLTGRERFVAACI